VDAGLISAEADARRAKMGPNAFTAVRKASKAQQVLRQYADPMQIVLVVAGVVCLFLPGQFFTGLMLLLLTLFNALMGLNQESRRCSAGSA
jgi:Ca2+-transporting ATPase